MSQKTTMWMMMLIAVLLVLNIAMERQSEAGAEMSVGPVQPVPVGIAVSTVYIYRLWSDGAVDAVKVNADSSCNPTTVIVPCNGIIQSDHPRLLHG